MVSPAFVVARFTLVSLASSCVCARALRLFSRFSRTFVISPWVDRLGPERSFLSYTKPNLEGRVESYASSKAEIEFDALFSFSARGRSGQPGTAAQGLSSRAQA